MKAQPAPLTHKLILLTLGLIAGCMAMIVVRLYSPNPEHANSDSATPSADSLADTIRHRWSTNRAVFTNRPPVGLASTAARPGGGFQAGAGTEHGQSSLEGATPTAATFVDQSRILTRTAVVRGQSVTIPAGSSAGIFGRVMLSGVPKPEIPIELGPSCGPLQTKPATTRHYVVSPDGGLANVLVVVLPQSEEVTRILEVRNRGLGPLLHGEVIDESASFAAYAPALTDSVLIDQRECMFEPYMVAMQKTQKLVVRNSDPVLHNQHFTPRRNREMNFGQPGLGPDSELQFPKSDAFIRIKCDVHPWMFAYVSVLPHPFFALTDTNGQYRISGGLPAGDYVLVAAHLKTGVLYDEKVALNAEKETRQDFQVSSVR